jgi:3-methyladenine DNA glycosylase AlkD
MTGAVAEHAQPTQRAVAFVAAHKSEAEALGARLVDHVTDPDALAAALRRGLERLADPEYVDGQHRVAPGLGQTIGIRSPLLAAIARAFKRETREDRATSILFVADRLFKEPYLEARWFAFGLLERTLTGERERTWQLLRRGAREAADWITVDTLAHPYATGVAAEPYRWAELEQLAYSPSRWERRLIGSTIATMTHGDRRTARGPDFVPNAIALLGHVMGDADPDVQKALAWAYRSLAALDPIATTAALSRQADLALEQDDGHRAWVVRDSLSKLELHDADALRSRLAGIRKRAGAPSTSAAAGTAAGFGALPDPLHHPEPPLT